MKARTLFVNATFWTGDRLNPWAEALLVEEGIIVAVGEKAQLESQSSGAKTVDLQGKLVVPGLHDSHIHLVNIGRMMEWVRLNETKSRKELVSRLRAYAEANPEATIILGRGFLQDNFDDQEMPTRHDLDQVATDKPVVVVRACGHISVANSYLLEMAGVGQGYVSERGFVDLDENGFPLGILREGAMAVASAHYPKETREDLHRYIKNAAKSALELGLTSVQTNDVGSTGREGWDMVFGAFQDYLEEDEVGLRINHQLLFNSVESLVDFHDWRQNTYRRDNDQRMSLGPVKLMCDGSLGGRTAHMLEPYADDASTLGIEIIDQQKKNEVLSLAHVLGYQMSGHAIGDGAIEGMLNAFETVLKATPKKDARPRIIHAQLTNQEQLLRTQRLGVVIDAQPGFVGTDLHIVEKRIGTKRAKTSYAWKTLNDLGVVLAGGSDAPVEPHNPWIGIGCAVTRQDPEGYPAGGWFPEQKLTLEQALYMYTYGSAFACFQEKEKGRLMRGMLADFVVLDRNIFEIEPEEIQETKTLATYISGVQVYAK